MPTSWIVEALQVIEHVCPSLIAGLVDFPARTLCLEAREETLHRSVVPYIARTAHAASDAMLLQQALELLTRVLGGFNRSSQHSIVEQILGIRLELRRVFSSQAFFGVSR